MEVAGVAEEVVAEVVVVVAAAEVVAEVAVAGHRSSGT